MSAERLTLFREIDMLTRIFAASIAVLALAAPSAALAEDAVAGAIVGAITGAAIATGAVVPYERREPLREYIVRESRPSYHYDDEVVVGRELPPGAYESYEVPEEYVPRGHHYTIINDRPVIFHPETRRIIHVYE
jgi:hypothetical protein